MKKGFTLIELLIIMILVGVLIGVALPKYQRAVERGRALEGINNARAAAQYAATKNAISGIIVTTTQDVTRNKNFQQVGEISIDANGNATASFSRSGNSGWYYTLTAVSDADGQITSISCQSLGHGVCTELGLEDLGVSVAVGQ